LSQQPVPGTRVALTTPGAGSSEVPYLALHPMGFSVPPCLRSERWALTPPFHPYRATPAVRQGMNRRYIFCGTVRQEASRPPARVYPRLSRGYAASRPLVFGLSSPGLHQERFSASPKSSRIYRGKKGMTRTGETAALAAGRRRMQAIDRVSQTPPGPCRGYSRGYGRNWCRKRALAGPDR
jgi:hypothetical protein